MKSLLRLLIVFCAALLAARYIGSPFVIYAAIGALLLGAARYLGYDVQGTPAIDFLLLAATILSYASNTHGVLRPSYDMYLLAIDQKLGLGWFVGKLFLESPALAGFCNVAYWGLPLAFAALYLCLPSKRDRSCLWRSMIITGILLYFTYHACPAAGPKYIFPNWPYAEPHTAPAVVFTKEPLNCMPSGHLTWALLIYWFSSTCRSPVRIAALIFLVLTGLATLGQGEHYWIDLIVAVPFAFLVYRLSHVHVTLRVPNALKART